MKKLMDRFFIWFGVPNDILNSFIDFHVIDDTWTYKTTVYHMDKKFIFVIPHRLLFMAIIGYMDCKMV